MSPHGHRSATATDDDAIESRDAGLFATMWRVGSILLRPELSRWRPVLVLALALTIASKFFAVVAPLYFGDAVNAVSRGEGGASLAITGLAMWVGARFLSTAFPYLRDAFFAPVSQDAQRLIAVDAFRHAQHLSMRFHLTRRTGALNRIIERGASALDFLIRFLAFNIGPTLIELALASMVLTAKFGWGMALVAIATVAVYILFTLLLTEWRVRQRRKMNEQDTALRAGAIDSMTNFATVKAFAAEDRETDKFSRSYVAYNKSSVETSRSLALLNAGQEFIMNAGLLGIAVLAALAAFRGELGPGDVAAVTLILMNLYRPLNILGWAWREIKQGGIDLEKLHGLMDMKPEVADAPDASPLAIGKGEIEFENVSFSHDGRSEGLNDVSFVAAAGRKLAVVGPSGAGKSTLLQLVFRFFDVDSGRVLFDGQDVRGLTQQSLRDAIGLVPQDVVLFNSTLRENVLYGRPDADQDDLDAAARQAQLTDFIAKLPKGWDTKVGERGLKLSGGEKQRVGIARAIIKNPPVLVLDEATSALDSTTETEVQAALDAASRGRTTIVVAHRLSTIAHAEMILVVAEGKIVERGTHDALLSLNGLYAGMWARQSRSANRAEEEEGALVAE